MLGSAHVFDRPGRKTFSSVNFAASHDGFTLADVTSYKKKRNEENGENGADGHGHNNSDNCGIEGETDDPEIQARRARRVRNLLATVFLSQGTPMLLAGDEFGRTQHGNNNSYCQDNATSWIDWSGADNILLTFAKRLLKLRRDNPVLRQGQFLHGQQRDDGYPDVAWSNLEGGLLDWRDPLLDSFCLQLRGTAENVFSDVGTALIVINGGTAVRRLVLPGPGSCTRWKRALDTAAPLDEPAIVDGLEDQLVAPHSLILFLGDAGAE